MEKRAQENRTKCSLALFVERLATASRMSRSIKQKFIMKWFMYPRRCVSIGRKVDVIGAVNADSAMWAARRKLVLNQNLQTLQTICAAMVLRVATC